jgi:hypothetical protein
MLISLGVSAALAAWTAASSANHENPELKRAESAVSNLRYDDALAALGRARTVRGNDRPTLLRILELQGVVASQLRKTKIAETAFRELLVLDPDHHLARDYAPRVMTTFYEAKRLVSEKGALVVQASDPDTASGEVHAINVQIASDPLAMAKAVRFHWRAEAGEWRESVAPVTSGKASAPAAGVEVSWWAEVIGDQDAVLVLVASGEKPRVDRAGGQPTAGLAPPPSAQAQENPGTGAVPLPPPFVTVSPEPTTVTATTSEPTSGLRLGSYVVLGGAVVAGGVGGYFGYQSQHDISTLQNALQSGQNPVVGITEKTAYNLNNESKQDAVIGNALFATAGVLAVGAVVLWLLGGSVAVAPTPSGATITGSF